MRTIQRAALNLMLFGLCIVSCERREESSAQTENEKRSASMGLVLTSFYPLQYFAERLAPPQLTVDCPLPPDADPIHWLPSSDAIQAFQQADLILINGTGFEKWLIKVTLPPSRVIDTTGFLEPEDQVRFESTITHRHGPGGEHSHEGLDGHTWVDPLLAVEQARQIAETLTTRWPQHAAVIQTGLEALSGDLLELDQRLQQFAANWAQRGGQLLASHPAYNYLARRYQLPFVNLDLSPEEAPDQATLESIAVYPRERFSDCLLWESEPAPAVAAALEAIGMRHVLFSPCENRPETGDYLDVMRANVARLEALITAE